MFISPFLLLSLGTGVLAGPVRSGDAEHERHKALELAVRQTGSQNQLMLQGFEWYNLKDGQHWNRLNGQLSKLSGIGISTLYIPPMTKAGANPSVGYDVYDLWDLGEFNQKGSVNTSWGTRQQLSTLISNARSTGISTLADGVLNQRSGADVTLNCQAHKVSPTNRLQSISGSQQIQAWVGFQYPGRGGKYSSKTWVCNDFSASDYDNLSKQNAIWKMDSNTFATDVSTENGNYDFLVLNDVSYESQSVVSDVKSWGSWVTQQMQLGGFRLDAAKHISKAFMIDWVNTVKAVNSNLLIVAEYLTGDPSVVQAYVNGFGSAISVFDTPLQTAFHDFSVNSRQDLRTILNNTWLARAPSQAVTYVNNHDTQPTQAIDSLYVSGSFVPLAYAISLLRQDGLPCIFFGDLYGLRTSGGSFTPAQYGSMVADLARARKYYAYGTQTDFFQSASVIGWTRQGDSSHPEGLAVVMSIGGYATIKMNVGKQHAGEVWSSLFGGSGATTIAADGTATFVAGAGTVNMYSRANASQRNQFGQWSTQF